MTMTDEATRPSAGFIDLAEVLEAKRDLIVARFVADLQRTELSPQGLSRALLIDHIPAFLDEVVVEVRRRRRNRASLDALDTSATAREHGEQRWSLGYDLGALIREYGVLRHCILHFVAEAGVTLSLDEVDVLTKCLSVGVAEAATAYAQFRDEQLNAQKATLEFLAEAGQLLSSSLDYRSTLSRLTGLLVPQLADWCAIHLDGVADADVPIAHRDPAKRELLRDLYVRFPSPVDSPHGQLHVRRTGEPKLVTTVDPTFWQAVATSAEHLGMLRELDTRSYLIVPLRIQANTFGAITLAFTQDRRFERADLVVAAELARRAAVAIDNARLYDLSQQERSRVEAATRAKDELLAVVSHELRTPLNAILGWVRLLRGGNLAQDKQGHALEVIERNAHLQNELVADLLDISKVITGKLRIHPAHVDVANVVELAIESVRAAADAKRITIEARTGATDLSLHADSERLQQVVWILLANAVKFTPKGGQVTVTLGRKDSDVQLIVQDNGEGIDPAFLPHVFESFRQSDNSTTRFHGGLGVGLSIAKHLVELHGGSIRARSGGQGLGAEFEVVLPIGPFLSTHVGVSRAAVLTQAKDREEPALADLHGIRVLLVDDEPDARDLVSYVLEKCGAEVHLASSAAEAMTLLEGLTPTLIISDVGMPDEDGYSFIRRIRTTSAEERRVIPAIALTAFARNEDRTRALVEGFNLYMAKPADPAALVGAILELTGAASAPTD